VRKALGLPRAGVAGMGEFMPESASEPSGFVAGVWRPPQMSHREFSARGGKARSEAKRQAVLRNLEKAKAARRARRAKAVDAGGEFPSAMS